MVITILSCCIYGNRFHYGFLVLCSSLRFLRSVFYFLICFFISRLAALHVYLLLSSYIPLIIYCYVPFYIYPSFLFWLLYLFVCSFFRFLCTFRFSFLFIFLSLCRFCFQFFFRLIHSSFTPSINKFKQMCNRPSSLGTPLLPLKVKLLLIHVQMISAYVQFQLILKCYKITITATCGHNACI